MIPWLFLSIMANSASNTSSINPLLISLASKPEGSLEVSSIFNDKLFLKSLKCQGGQRDFDIKKNKSKRKTCKPLSLVVNSDPWIAYPSVYCLKDDLRGQNSNKILSWVQERHDLAIHRLLVINFIRNYDVSFLVIYVAILKFIDALIVEVRSAQETREDCSKTVGTESFVTTSFCLTLGIPWLVYLTHLFFEREKKKDWKLIPLNVDNISSSITWICFVEKDCAWRISKNVRRSNTWSQTHVFLKHMIHFGLRSLVLPSIHIV